MQLTSPVDLVFNRHINHIENINKVAERPVKVVGDFPLRLFLFYTISRSLGRERV